MGRGLCAAARAPYAAWQAGLPGGRPSPRRWCVRCRFKGSFGAAGPGVGEDAPVVLTTLQEASKETKANTPNRPGAESMPTAVR